MAGGGHWQAHDGSLSCCCTGSDCAEAALAMHCSMRPRLYRPALTRPRVGVSSSTARYRQSALRVHAAGTDTQAESSGQTDAPEAAERIASGVSSTGQRPPVPQRMKVFPRDCTALMLAVLCCRK